MILYDFAWLYLNLVSARNKYHANAMIANFIRFTLVIIYNYKEKNCAEICISYHKQLEVLIKSLELVHTKQLIYHANLANKIKIFCQIFVFYFIDFE